MQLIKQNLQHLISVPVAWVIYQLNFLLRFLADLFVSSHLDRLASRYSQWYNKILMSELLNHQAEYKGKLRMIRVTNQETINDLMITELYHHNVAKADLELYLASKLSKVAGVNPELIQISHLSPRTTKLVFPIAKYG